MELFIMNNNYKTGCIYIYSHIFTVCYKAFLNCLYTCTAGLKLFIDVCNQACIGCLSFSYKYYIEGVVIIILRLHKHLRMSLYLLTPSL